MQKAIAFVLPTNLGEAFIVLLAVLFFPFEAGVSRLPGRADADPLGQPDRHRDARAAARRRGAGAGRDDAGLWTNPWALAGIAGVLALQAAFVYAPPMHELFGSAPLSAEEWLLALAAAATVLPIVSVEKWWRRRGLREP